MNKETRILLTGSSGMIGTRVFEVLLREGYEVIGFDRKKNHWVPALNELTIQGDLLKKKDLQNVPTDIDLIIHLAANARVYNLVVEPDLALENIVTTHHVLEFAKTRDIPNIIFAGSREVYGNKGGARVREKDVDLSRCESPYAASKMSGEALVQAFSACYELSFIIFRFSNVYGRYDTSDRFIPLLIRNMRKNKDVYIYGEEKVLDFTYIDDCVDGILRGVKRFSRAKNRTFNIASGKGVQLCALGDLLKIKLESTSRIIAKSIRAGEVLRYVADISQAQEVLGYQPRTSLEKGIDAAIQWYTYERTS
ncbi:MAG: NAD-dependent epimerase/dehydratase family protein [Candidatus Yanofskybacteria bacterium]|nr:NAD-dependent epimerase/dehydratase family protein [Candidatus Yanofskybacteria bacterium]